MHDALALMGAAAASLTGFALLALGQERHWEAVTGLGQNLRLPASRLRPLGMGAQLLACALFVIAEGPGFGALLWGLAMTTAATCVALTLTWSPTALRPLARVLRLRRPR